MAGRSLGPGLLFATILAANIGAGSTVGAAGLGYRDGLSGWWWVGSAGIGTLILAFTVGPRIWRLAREHDLLTAGDYLEWRYGPSVRAIMAVLLWFVTLAIPAGQLIGIAWILEVVAGIPKPVGCLIGGIVITAYFTAGGLLTSAWVNVIQLAVMGVGFAIAAPLILVDVGGWTALTEALPAGDHLGFFRGGGSGWIYVALLGPAFIVSPGLIQKVYGARDERAIRIGLGLGGVALMAFAFVPPVLGMLAYAYEPSLASPELSLPTVLVRGLPPALGLLTLAAVFSAELSSADAGLFMLSTSLSKDVYHRFIRPDASDHTLLAVARWAAIVGGGLATLLALFLPSVIASLSIFYSLLTVTLFVPIVGGLYARRLGTPEALAAIGVGLTALVAGALWVRAAPGSLWTPFTIGLIASLVAVAVVTALRRRPA